mmetsp:Transcript_116542/g.334564  ORF Transcript_116542/g.334564 Transcript_116542/m.334564 type:complete len:240 (-) Transcript_116542:96-815(-)
MLRCRRAGYDRLRSPRVKRHLRPRCRAASAAPSLAHERRLVNTAPLRRRRTGGSSVPIAATRGRSLCRLPLRPHHRRWIGRSSAPPAATLGRPTCTIHGLQLHRAGHPHAGATGRSRHRCSHFRGRCRAAKPTLLAAVWILAAQPAAKAVAPVHDVQNPSPHRRPGKQNHLGANKPNLLWSGGRHPRRRWRCSSFGGTIAPSAQRRPWQCRRTGWTCTKWSTLCCAPAHRRCRRRLQRR